MVGNIVWNDGKEDIVPKSVFNKIDYMVFEGRKYSVPAGYHEWLTNYYGNYMELPPVEKRISHHKFEAYLK